MVSKPDQAHDGTSWPTGRGRVWWVVAWSDPPRRAPWRWAVPLLDDAARGARNAEIAGQLVISESTVKAHVGNILRKLHATNRSQAVAHYLDLGRRS